MSVPTIIFEDDDILVVDKPAGMVVNRADTTKNMITLQEWAEGKLRVERGEMRNDELSEFEKRGGIVHRLDKETSGVIVVAKNEESFINLQAQFKGRNVNKTYLALVHGELKPEESEINVPIGRLPWNRTRFGVLAEGREAMSKYKVLSIKYLVTDKVSEPLSLVEVYPATGRTHQIRVHMRHVGHPVFADELYAGRKVSKRDRKILPRHFLHASRIVLNHPSTRQDMTFESPLPPDLKQFTEKLSQ